MIERKIVTTVNLSLEFIDKAIRLALADQGTPVPDGGELEFVLSGTDAGLYPQRVTRAVLTIETDANSPPKSTSTGGFTCAICGEKFFFKDNGPLCGKCLASLPGHEKHNKD